MGRTNEHVGHFWRIGSVWPGTDDPSLSQWACGGDREARGKGTAESGREASHVSLIKMIWVTSHWLEEAPRHRGMTRESQRCMPTPAGRTDGMPACGGSAPAPLPESAGRGAQPGEVREAGQVEGLQSGSQGHCRRAGVQSQAC